jgi:hypothetical protein
MRTTIVKIAAFGLVALSLVAQAADLIEYENACIEIGFRKKTQAFGECVLELDRRGKDRAGKVESARTQPVNNPSESGAIVEAKGDGTSDDQACQKYGYRPGEGGYPACRIKLDLARQEAYRARQQYEEELKRYEVQLAEAERERERQRARRQVELGLRMMAGQPPLNALAETMGVRPIAPPQPKPTTQTIVLPNGRIVTCTTVATSTSCF